MTQKTVVQLLDFVPNSWRSMEQFLLELAATLRSRGWRTVHVFAGEPSEIVRRKLADLESPYLVSKNPLSRERAIALGKQLRDFQPQVIETHFLSKFDPALPHVKRHSGARRLVVDDQSSGVVSRKPLPLQVLAWVRGRRTAGYVDQIIGISDFVCQRDIRDVFFPAGQVRRVYNGVDLQRFSPPESVAPNTVFTVAFVGQLIPEKGVHTLIAAVKVLADEGHALKLLLAGQGAHEGTLRQQVKDLGLDSVVDFLGQIDWASKLYSQADVVVAPSEWAEAFGFVAAEAAACGACLVTSDAGGLPEIVGPDGGAGRIFPKGQVQALASVLRELLKDPAQRSRLRVAGRKRMQEYFSLDAMVKGHAECLEET
jgi:glycosyltransferase involved in cell wall biosynthesis